MQGLRVVRQRPPSKKQSDLLWNCSPVEHVLLRRMLLQLVSELQDGAEGKEYFLLSNATVKCLDGCPRTNLGKP